MNASLLYLHTPKTGGSTIGSLFQPHRRLYRVVPHPTPPLPARIKFYGGHRGAPMLDRLCNPKHECCVWLAIVREPLERLAQPPGPAPLKSTAGHPPGRKGQKQM